MNKNPVLIGFELKIRAKMMRFIELKRLNYSMMIFICVNMYVCMYNLYVHI